MNVFAIYILISALLSIFILSVPPYWKAVPRTEVVKPSLVIIDNDFYDKEDFSVDWWNENGWAQGLHKMNNLRADYFKNIIETVLLKNQTQKRDIQLVDLGCGGGLLTETLGRRGMNITGIDISSNSITIAKKHLEGNPLPLTKVEYLVGSVYSTPFPSAYAHVVVMSDVLEHLNDLPQLAKEVNRILKPGGLFLFDTINRTWLSYILNILSEVVGIVPPHTHDWKLFVTPEEITELFAKEKIETKEFYGMQIKLSFVNVLKKVKLSSVLDSFVLGNNVQMNFIGYAVKNV